MPRFVTSNNQTDKLITTFSVFKTQFFLINTNKHFNHEVRNQDKQQNQKNFCIQRAS